MQNSIHKDINLVDKMLLKFNPRLFLRKKYMSIFGEKLGDYFSRLCNQISEETGQSELGIYSGIKHIANSIKIDTELTNLDCYLRECLDKRTYVCGNTYIKYINNKELEG